MIEQKYKNRYYLNGINIYDRWGIIIERGGYEELTRRAQRKEQYSRVWLDRNGTQRYTNSALFNTKSVTLPFTFLCKDKEDYLEKSKSFFDYLMFGGASGYFDLYVSELKMEFKLLYNTVSSVEDKTALYNEESFGSVIITHNIQLDDDFIEVEYGEKDFSSFVSTWDTRNVSAGSSADDSIIIPMTRASYNLMINFGDGTPIRPLLYGTSVNTINGDNLIPNDKLISAGFSYAKDYKSFFRFTSGMSGREILGATNDLVYISYKLDTPQNTTVFKLIVTYNDDTLLDVFPNTKVRTTKPIKHIRLSASVQGDLYISELMISTLDIPYKPALVDLKPIHKYARKGVYRVEISGGQITNFRMNDGPEKLKLISIDNWGNFYTADSAIFLGSNNLTLNTTLGYPKFNSMSFMFNWCSKVRRINNLDLFDIKDTKILDSAFAQIVNFNGIGLEFWNVSNVTTAINFMQNNNGMSPTTYDRILKKWSKQNLQRNVVWNFGNAKYTAEGEVYRNDMINKFNLTIQDGGKL